MMHTPAMSQAFRLTVLALAVPLRLLLSLSPIRPASQRHPAGI